MKGLKKSLERLREVEGVEGDCGKFFKIPLLACLPKAGDGVVGK